MYPQFFGFDKLPFRLRPDPDFLYSGHEYLRARAKVIDDLRGRSRVVLLTGPAGVGKTLLLEEVLREIGGQFRVCRINQPHISAPELIQALLFQLGAPPAAATAHAPVPHARVMPLPRSQVRMMTSPRDFTWTQWALTRLGNALKCSTSGPR